MNKTAKLTEREIEVAELRAWGLATKDVADKLFLSVRTIENHTRNIYEKLDINSVSELSAWWFCTRYDISFSLSPLKRKVRDLMNKKTSMTVYFIICMILISADITTTSSTLIFSYYTFVLLNLANVIRLVTNYDNKRHE